MVEFQSRTVVLILSPSRFVVVVLSSRLFNLFQTCRYISPFFFFYRIVAFLSHCRYLTFYAAISLFFVAIAAGAKWPTSEPPQIILQSTCRVLGHSRSSLLFLDTYSLTVNVTYDTQTSVIFVKDTKNDYLENIICVQFIHVQYFKFKYIKDNVYYI